MSDDINLNQAIFALTDALDLVGIDEVRHGKRVGYMAFCCAEAMGLSAPDRERLFHIGLLHDCGVSSSRVHTHLVAEMQWEHAQAHATEGAELVDTFAPLRSFSDAIRYHHTPWQDLVQIEALDPAVRLEANLIFLVDRVDTLGSKFPGMDLLDNTSTIIETIADHGGTLFAPELVDTFARVARSGAFWMMLESRHLDRYLDDVNRQATPILVPFHKIRHLAWLFSRIVDAKSHYTYQHSIGVAQLARYLAECLGLDQMTLDKIEVAGLLHDLGKLRVPDEVLDKRGSLDPHDLRMIHRHSFETYQILRRVGGFEDIALWAAYHHETPRGDGYPFQREGAQLSIEARIIAVADVFQALAQDRPYRAAMSLSGIIAILGELAGEERLDADVVALVAAQAEQCLRAATEPDETHWPGTVPTPQVRRSEF